MATWVLRKELCVSVGNHHQIYIACMRGADKSLARPTSRCRRTESVVSLERRVCSCTEWHVFSCYRGWKEACHRTHAISTTSRQELSPSTFSYKARCLRKLKPFWEKHRGKCTIIFHHQKLGGLVWRWWFVHVCCASFWTIQSSDHPGYYSNIHELIFEDRRISAKPIAEQLGISREWVGSIIHEDLDMRKLSAKWVPKCLNADQKRQRCQSSEQLLEFFRRDPDDFLSRLVTMDETWLYHYMTRRQSNNQWSGGIAAHPAPKNSECKNPLENFSPRFFGIKTASSSLIIFQRAILSTRSITHLCWCNWRSFWRTNAVGSSRRGSCSCTTMPRLTVTCNPKETGLLGLPISWSPTLFSGSGPVGLPPIPWTEKNNLKIAIFLPTRNSLLSRRPGWTDKLLFFFKWLAKVRATG